MTIRAISGIEYRFAERSGAPKLEGGRLSGRAAPFNITTMIGKKPWGFREKIAPGAFSKSVNDGDVVLLDNHDTAKPIARQSAGTLLLDETSGGLDWDAKPADTTYANDVVENSRAGNYGGCSFGFEVVRDSWHYNKDDDVDERTLHEVKLHEISVCTFPAYGEGTSVSARDQVDAAMEARDMYYEREYGDWLERGVSDDDIRDGKAPYGNVAYADPGYQKDGKKRYPIDTKAHAKAAWNYINKVKNAGAYSAKQLASIKAKIKAACKKFGIKVNDAPAPASQKNSAKDDTVTRTVTLKGGRKLVAKVRKAAFDASLTEAEALVKIREFILDDLVERSEFADAEIARWKEEARANKVGTSADNDADGDDPVCEACGGSGMSDDGVSQCAGGCAGTGRVAGGGDNNAGDGSDSAEGHNLTGGFDGGANTGPNNQANGNSGASDNPAIGSGGPQDGSGSVNAGNPGSAPKDSEAGSSGGPQTYSKETSGETRDGQPGTPTDPEGSADAARQMRAVARRRRMQADAEA